MTLHSDDRDTILNTKKLIVAAAEEACCAGIIIVRDAVVQVFTPAPNVLDLETKDLVITQPMGGAQEDGESRRCKVAVDKGVPRRRGVVRARAQAWWVLANAQGPVPR